MRKYVILAQSEVTADTLNAWLEMLGEVSLCKGDMRRIVWEEKATDGDAFISAYEALVRRVELAAIAADGNLPLNEVVILVDRVQPDKLSAIYEAASWDNLLALLILSFPEIHWVFGFAGAGSDFLPEHTLDSLWSRGHRDPLLDPVGLRRKVRSQTTRELKHLGDDLELPERIKLAAAIDEEKGYAYLNGYTAYRFGCRVDVVTTWALMKELFGGEKEGEADASHNYWLLLEDMSLNFPDKPNQIHLLRLDEYKENQGREYWCPKLNSSKVLDSIPLEKSAYRILVTTGQARALSTLEGNQKYLKNKKTGVGDLVFKPASGMFGLWKDAKLLKKPSLFKRERNEVDFKWPPASPETRFLNRAWNSLKHRRTWTNTPAQEEAETDNKGHGSPGKLMLVAETLIRRSKELLDKPHTVEAAIQGAVLATEALELTGGRTPTSALDALTLKHHFEVLAECQFPGVGHQRDIKRRWQDIEAETDNIGRWFQKKEAAKAALNARMHVLSHLVQVLRENNQFDGEQYCMIRVRNLHNSLWMKQRRGGFLFLPLLRYFELLMTSILWFVVCLLLWVLIFGWLFKWSGHYPTYWYGLFDAISSIFSVSVPFNHKLSPSDPQIPGFYAVVVCGAIIVGVTHLGVFVSHLYTIVSRK
jgi:hypothetical protein